MVPGRKVAVGIFVTALGVMACGAGDRIDPALATPQTDPSLFVGVIDEAFSHLGPTGWSPERTYVDSLLYGIGREGDGGEGAGTVAATPTVMAARVKAIRAKGWRPLARNDGARCQWPYRVSYDGCPLELPGTYVGVRMARPSGPLPAEPAEVRVEAHVWIGDSLSIKHIRVDMVGRPGSWRAEAVETLLGVSGGAG